MRKAYVVSIVLAAAIYSALTVVGLVSQTLGDGFFKRSRNYDANSGYSEVGVLQESLTLSTSGTTTDTTANLLPANSVILAVNARVTTTITTATNWSVGDTTTATRFSSANSTLTAGTTSVGLNQWKGAVATDATGPTQVSAAKVRVTTTGTPGAGAIRLVVFYRRYSAPTS
jgi:hypothetical protein